MRIRCIYFLLILSITSLRGQSTYFNNQYNYNNFSPALSVVEHENNYVFYGVTYDSINNSISAYIASVDSVGTINFWNTISDSTKEYWAGYRGCGLVKVGMSGFAAAGSVGAEIDSSNAILYRFNNLGDTLWTKQYSDPNEFLAFNGCNTTNDNGFIMIGFQLVWNSFSDILLIKVDSNGNEQWRKEYGLNEIIEKGYNVVQTPDNGYFIGYYKYDVYEDTTGDPVVMKVDSLGNFEWERNIGGPTRDFFTQVCLGNDSSYIAGTSLSDSLGQEIKYSRIKIYKFSSLGDILWEKYYGSTDIDNILYAIKPDNDGGYVATGKRNDYYNPQGQWWNSYGWLLKIDEDGDSIWYREYSYYKGSTYDNNKLYDLCLTSDGGYTMVGQVTNWIEPQTAWVIKVDSIGCDTPDCQTVNIKEISEFSDNPLSIYPNPAITEILVKIQYPSKNSRNSIVVYDLFGRKQDEIEIPAKQSQVRVNVLDYPGGVYIAILKSENDVIGRGKFIKR